MHEGRCNAIKLKMSGLSLPDILKQRDQLYQDIKVHEQRLKEEYRKLKIVHIQLEDFIMKNHPNPKCRHCGARLKDHKLRHRFEPGLNNLRDLDYQR